MTHRNTLIKKIIDLAVSSKEGHIASSLSILDILIGLYSRYIDITDQLDRNRVIVSKGHASLSIFAVLDEYNILQEDLSTFCKFNSAIGGHPCDKVKGIEASTGSLGHGLPIGIGMAFAYKAKEFKNHIYVIIGDGEMNEGTIWESLLLASYHNLNNLTCILDYNHSNDRSIKLDVISKKIEAFNWSCTEIDGHSQEEINTSLSIRHNCKPTFIIANTIKGKGISFMENNPEWHHKTPNSQEYQKILEELA